MAKTNTQITRELKDDPVLQLQKNLNQNGYSLSEDGILGNETLAAVKDYQSKNGVSAEGVNTKQPRSALATKSTGANNANVDNDTGFNYETFDYDDYVKSETVSQAMAALNSQLGAKPGELQSTWEGGSKTKKRLYR